MGVYTLYKLGRSTGAQFDKSIKFLDRDFHVVQNGFAEDTNAFSEMNGLLYEKSEEATELYYNHKPFKDVVAYTPFEEVKPNVRIEETVAKKSDENWVDNEADVQEPKEDIVVKPTLPKQLKKQDIKESVKELRATYLKLSGIVSKPSWGAVKLTQEISNLKKE
jgi:hypothetical protein